MKDLTPRCPHCNNLTLVGTVAGRMVAVCAHCDNGFAVASTDHQNLMTMPAQQLTRTQLEKATEQVLQHITQIATAKQDELLAAESRLPGDREAWTEAEHQQAATIQSQRMMYAGVLQGSSSFRDLFARAVGLPVTTLTSAPIPPVEAPATTPAPAGVTSVADAPAPATTTPEAPSAEAPDEPAADA